MVSVAMTTAPLIALRTHPRPVRRPRSITIGTFPKAGISWEIREFRGTKEHRLRRGSDAGPWVSVSKNARLGDYRADMSIIDTELDMTLIRVIDRLNPEEISWEVFSK